MDRPFLPSEIQKADPLQDWRRAILARALAERRPGAGGNLITDVVERLWPNQTALQERILQRAATTIGGTTNWGAPLAGIAAGEYIRSLRPRSAAAQLFDVAGRVTLAGAASATLPRLQSAFPDPTFVGEGSPIPVMQGAFGSVTVGPLRKLAMITSLTSELSAHTADTAETTLRLAMDDSAAHALDAAVFSAAAASDVRPAGLLNGVTALTATTGGGQIALAGDAKKLVGAIADAGGGTDIAFYVNPQQAVSLSIYAPNFAYPVIGAPSLAAGTVVAVERAAIASAFAGLPDVTVSRDAVVHFENASPQDIATGGAIPSGASMRSAFQSDLIMLKLILPCAWSPLLPGMVQTINGVTW